MNQNNNDSKFSPPPGHTPTYAGASSTPPHPMNAGMEHQAAAAGGSPYNPNMVSTPSGTPSHLIAPQPRKSSMDCLQLVNLGLRIACLLLSFLGFILMVTIKSFDVVEAYSYLVAMSAISFVYAAFQVVMAVIHLVSGKGLIPEKLSPGIDFLIDQVMAYLCMSAASAVFSVTVLLKKQDSWDEMDAALAKAGAAGSMIFFAFLTLAVSSLMSIHRLFQLKPTSTAK